MAKDVVRPAKDEITTLEPSWPGGPGGHAVTELTAQNTGALSPFGDDIRFPLPLAAIRYQHATARPNR
ncbi:hypothetical protein [Blastococcus sp. Marseille-P5729]|uniref:hypothetical protein n=1 Tax=Blastococcus sp. Marseille-P5729 TaxID=2086582 RepID=UPI000D10E1B6|nr:hypothetical protein [Blastococcus sp. Marseille-P5729]